MAVDFENQNPTFSKEKKRSRDYLSFFLEDCTFRTAEEQHHHVGKQLQSYGSLQMLIFERLAGLSDPMEKTEPHIAMKQLNAKD